MAEVLGPYLTDKKAAGLSYSAKRCRCAVVQAATLRRLYR